MKRQEIIFRALSGTLTWSQVADTLGLDPRSLRRWRARYQSGGVAALYDAGSTGRRGESLRGSGPALVI
jgi:transposase-like protein